MVENSTNLYGLMAEFKSPEALRDAARRLLDAGYRRFDAFTPFPVEGLPEDMGVRPTRLPGLVLAGAAVGGLGGFAMQFYTAVFSFPVNVGGRPLNSWPSFIPITFETTILLASLTAVVAMIALNGLPTLYHPVFNVPRFAHASQDGFFLCVEASDSAFDVQQTAALLKDLGATEVWHVGV